MGRAVLAVCLVVWGIELGAATVNKGYATQLTLNGPIEPGTDQRIEGSGAPVGLGVYVELWRVGPLTAIAESVASVPATDGAFSFEGIDVEEGESYYVTLSRSWNFDTDGEAEGWDTDPVDVSLEVSGGKLNATIDGTDPHFFNLFEYDSDLYRVIELRLRNPSPAPDRPSFGQDLGIYWNDVGNQVDLHFSEIHSEAPAFETVFIPMNVGEAIVFPGPLQLEVDGLWATGLRDSLRLDPLDTVTPAAVGTTFEIDYIRIREDFRLDFNSTDDSAGLEGANVDKLTVADGFLSYQVTDALDPYLFFPLRTGKVESGYFTSFVIGMDNSVADASGSLAVAFNDDDSGDSFIDDGGTAQVAELDVSLSGRQDLAMVMDLHTEPQGEWTEDGRVPVEGLQLNVPAAANAGDQIRIDYLGFIPENPYGPSETVAAAFLNHPPVAVIVSDPDPAEVFLEKGAARIVLDGRLSDDGDGGTQELSYWWDVVSGPAPVAIDRPEDPVVEVILCGAGEFLLRLTVDDGDLSDSADIVVVVRTERERKRRERIERRIEKLRSKIARLEGKIERIEGCIAALMGKIECLKAKLPDASGKKRRRIERRIERLERRIERKKKRIERREHVIAKLEEKIAELEEKLA